MFNGTGGGKGGGGFSLRPVTTELYPCSVNGCTRRLATKHAFFTHCCATHPQHMRDIFGTTDPDEAQLEYERRMAQAPQSGTSGRNEARGLGSLGPDASGHGSLSPDGGYGGPSGRSGQHYGPSNTLMVGGGGGGHGVVGGYSAGFGGNGRVFKGTHLSLEMYRPDHQRGGSGGDGPSGMFNNDQRRKKSRWDKAPEQPTTTAPTPERGSAGLGGGAGAGPATGATSTPGFAGPAVQAPPAAVSVGALGQGGAVGAVAMGTVAGGGGVRPMAGDAGGTGTQEDRCQVHSRLKDTTSELGDTEGLRRSLSGFWDFCAEASTRNTLPEDLQDVANQVRLSMKEANLWRILSTFVDMHVLEHGPINKHNRPSVERALTSLRGSGVLD